MMQFDGTNGGSVAELGRGRVAAELQRAGLAVSRPAHPRDPFHLVAQATDRTDPSKFVRRPIRVQAASQSSFRVLRSWNKPADVILAYTWHVASPAESVTYALTYEEAATIVEQMGWHMSASWRVHGGYGTTSAEQNRRLHDLLAPYKMTPGRWCSKIAPDPR